MSCFSLVVYCLFNIGLAVSTHLTFPDDFKFGAATSAYQIEGAWNESGKGVSNWDSLTHSNQDFILDGSNGDVACDSYHKYKEDVQMLSHLGVDYYRFSIAWTRILPNGFPNGINQAGVDYYNNLIDDLLANNIQPAVTLFHFDTPYIFSPLGYWANDKLIGFYVAYARLAFNLFGDRVKLWLTINEPKVFCQESAYGLAEVIQPYPLGVVEYECGHNILKAHAEVYHIYDKEFRPTQHGKITIVLNFEWEEPASDCEEDLKAAETRRLFEFGWFAHPIVYGDYPQIMIDRIAARSKAENFTESRLPEFTPEEKHRIRGTYDFFAINHYSTWLAEASAEAPIGLPSYYSDMGTTRYQPTSWEGTALSYFKVVPWGLRRLLNWVKKTYIDPEIYITECGYAGTGVLEDDARINFLRGYLHQCLLAIHEDHVKLKGFITWSLMDNFEWYSGYTIKFGLYYVDFNSTERTRTPKKSVDYFKNIVLTRSVE